MCLQLFFRVLTSNRQIKECKAVIKQHHLASKEKRQQLKFTIMKQLLIAILMCITAIAGKAQVLTSETVKNGYETVVNMPESDFAFNADYTGDDIATMYVYEKIVDRKDMVLLTPHRKYEYTYSADGMLTSKVTFQWDDMNYRWTIASRHDYILNNDTYSIEYSHYNKNANSFEQPVDKMVYTLQPYSDIHNISHYRRQDSSTPYQLISEIQVTETPLLFAEKKK